ncbi:hypothetical protein BDP27DRAFT_1362630 [Rhodocollybia butyracea]|uniref:Uncharacterized protein n=1 Tax=Rhodocollybia butyracea TaxID=206335 RepID=A0A9P5U9T2_9AGAR|nr:hypothetical protein BDP27DRAFT_1362630 [Rhodocollybia butyracea]
MKKKIMVEVEDKVVKFETLVHYINMSAKLDRHGFCVWARIILFFPLFAMGATRKPLPDGFEEDPTDSNKVRCTLCHRLTPHAKGGGYMNRAPSYANRHLATAAHIENLERKKASHTSPTNQPEMNPYIGSSHMGTNPSIPVPGSLPSFLESENVRFQFKRILVQELYSNSNEDSEDAIDGDEPTEHGVEDSLFNPVMSAEKNHAYYPYPSKLKDLQSVTGGEPKPFTSVLGNHFHVNDLHDAVQRNFANPCIAKHLNFYPEETNGPISEVWQCHRWKEYSPSEHTPMYSSSGKQFYINKVAALDDGHKTQLKPIMCYNAATQRMCGACLRVPGLPGDNPQQAEEASHAGGNANCLCRKCNVGGSYEETESDHGYHCLYATGVARSAEQTRNRLLMQLDAAMMGVKSVVTKMQRETGTKDKVAQYWIDILLKKSQELKREDPRRSKDDISAELKAWLAEQPGDKINPLLDIADDQKALFVIHLQSTDLDGLTVPPLCAAYMMQYSNNLIGKHFKTLMQTMAFHVQDMVAPAHFELIKSVGELGAMLWVHEIDNMDTYLHELEIIIGNTLDAFAAIDPAKIIDKIKLHLLPHAISDIRRFGPLIRSSTEGFECFNAVFRMCSVYSNGQAPSCDIAVKFSGMDRMKHIVSGGYWYDKEQGDWVQASSNVQNILKTHPIIQRHLRWVSQEAIEYGVMKPHAQGKTSTFTWSSTKASLIQSHDFTLWNNNLSVIAQSGDSCKVGSWVAIRRSDTTRMNLPVLYWPPDDSDVKYVVVPPCNVLFRLSVQHDCCLAKCTASGSRNVVQEHQITPQKTCFIEHKDDDRFVINMTEKNSITKLQRNFVFQKDRCTQAQTKRKATMEGKKQKLLEAQLARNINNSESNEE